MRLAHGCRPRRVWPAAPSPVAHPVPLGHKTLGTAPVGSLACSDEDFLKKPSEWQFLEKRSVTGLKPACSVATPRCLSVLLCAVTQSTQPLGESCTASLPGVGGAARSPCGVTLVTTIPAS